MEEYARWTGDLDLVRALQPEARAAVAWIDQYGDRDGDGYIEYPAAQSEGAGEPVLEGFRGFHRLQRRNPGGSPQAWASGAPLLLIRALLGLEAADGQMIVNSAVPDAIGRLELLDIPGSSGAGATPSAGRAPADLGSGARRPDSIIAHWPGQLRGQCARGPE
jgi:glycogen debranching enzyme